MNALTPLELVLATVLVTIGVVGFTWVFAWAALKTRRKIYESVRWHQDQSARVELLLAEIAKAQSGALVADKMETIGKDLGEILSPHLENMATAVQELRDGQKKFEALYFGMQGGDIGALSPANQSSTELNERIEAGVPRQNALAQMLEEEIEFRDSVG
ncbi:MAG: hypothetical protein HC888_16700 [Candidatus Competibacteraceae bacterium]|nr:hypothetical protein [Candidatus Competibacteraceae bacterium]